MMAWFAIPSLLSLQDLSVSLLQLWVFSAENSIGFIPQVPEPVVFGTNIGIGSTSTRLYSMSAGHGGYGIIFVGARC